MHLFVLPLIEREDHIADRAHYQRKQERECMHNHPTGTVQRIFFTNNNSIALKNIKNDALDIANQYEYLMIFLEDNPDP
jgi:hypothetical protein